ncbi:MAG: SCO family protein [Blastochloris viridis]|uniref:SCO family protein n=1 Tax=Blastochloris viridis TaxID=1079 RepID=A0A6N4R7H2_BLAVI|nr:MAG: SCO family protein [Blastochloris viridis]
MRHGKGGNEAERQQRGFCEDVFHGGMLRRGLPFRKGCGYPAAMLKYVFTALAVVTALLAGLAFYLSRQPLPPVLPQASHSADIHFTQPFTLTNMHSQTVTEKTFLGKPTLYFFGFTHCPDVCPTTLGAMAGWLKQLGDAQAAKLNVVFVSVDPSRDTPETLREYVTAFHPHIIGVTGTDEELKAVAKQFMVYYAKVPNSSDPNDYTMNHSSMILLADRNGTFVGTLDAHDPQAKAITTLKNLL